MRLQADVHADDLDKWGGCLHRCLQSLSVGGAVLPDAPDAHALCNQLCARWVGAHGVS